MTNSRILVTGSGGAIGGALNDIAQDEFPEKEFIFVTSSECDLTDLEMTASLIARTSPDAIIHLAAIAGGVALNKEHPAKLLRNNVQMNLNVLEAARAASVRKTVMTLSSGIYPASAPLPLKEETLHDGYPDESNYGYAFAKRLVDPMIRSYREEYGMNVIGLLPNNTIGEHSSFREGVSGVVPALIRRFFENRQGTEPLTVWGDGTPLREISYAKDIARIFIWCLDEYDDAQILNIGSTEEISIHDIAITIATALQISSERIVFDTSMPSGPVRKNTDNSKLTALCPLGYIPAREAISLVATHFVEHGGTTDRIRA